MATRSLAPWIVRCGVPLADFPAGNAVAYEIFPNQFETDVQLLRASMASWKRRIASFYVGHLYIRTPAYPHRTRPIGKE